MTAADEDQSGYDANWNPAEEEFWEAQRSKEPEPVELKSYDEDVYEPF